MPKLTDQIYLRIYINTLSMTNYTLVRESRDGRQSDEDKIHCIKIDSEETICNNLSRKELCAVRTLSVFIGESNLCDDCSNEVDGLD